MVTEIEHARALNRQAWSILSKKTVPFAILMTLSFLYSKHCDLHENARSRSFYNRSKLFGGAKTPQY
jgi:hypothetical protein